MKAALGSLCALMKNNKVAASKNSFDVRIVRYEYIHSIKAEFFDRLVKAVDPRNSEALLDAGCGYGAVTREILKRHKDKRLNCYLADSCDTQLSRACTELANIGFGHESSLSFYKDDLVDTTFEDGTFNTIVAKMLIHEIPAEKQQVAINNAHTILKSGGKLIIWDMTLDESNQRFIQDVIRMKDRLAGFHTLEANRYFLRLDELKFLLDKAGFKDVKLIYKIISPVVSKKRLKPEFGDSKLKLLQWHDFIRSKASDLDPSVLNRLQFKDEGDSISFTPPKAIIVATK